MMNLIKTEWLKMRSYRAFWWMTLVVALSYPGINWVFYAVYQDILGGKGTASQLVKMLGNPFTFPEIWHTASYFSSIFIFIPVIAVVMFISNEFTYKTHRQNIIDGWSRNQFMFSKLIDVLFISLLVTLMYMVISLVIGYINIDDKSGNIMDKSRYIFLFFLQTFSQLSIAFLIAFLTKKAFLALGIFFFYYIVELIGSAIMRNYQLDKLAEFLPLEISDMVVPVPTFLGTVRQQESPGWYDSMLAAVTPHVIYTLVLTTLVWALCFWINKKRDL